MLNEKPKISESTRYIASYLKQFEDEFTIITLPYGGDYKVIINEEKLAELLQEYFDNRR